LEALQQTRQEVDLRRTDAASKGLHASFDVKKCMHDRSIRVNKGCYRSLMEMCGYSKLADAAKLVFEDMKNHNVVPDTISYNAFVQAVIRTQDEIGVTKFKSLRRYRCVGELLPADSSSEVLDRSVRMRLCTADGRGIGFQDEALVLATWAAQCTSYDDWAYAPSLRLLIEHRDASGVTIDSSSCSFVSPFTLLDELEGLLAHWTDSLLTIVEPWPSQSIRLRKEHHSAFWCCVWFFHNLGLPTEFLLPQNIEVDQNDAEATGLANHMLGHLDGEEIAALLAQLPKWSGARRADHG